MYTLYKFHFLNGITEINQLFDDILIIRPAPVYDNGVDRTGRQGIEEKYSKQEECKEKKITPRLCSLGSTV